MVRLMIIAVLLLAGCETRGNQAAESPAEPPAVEVFGEPSEDGAAIISLAQITADPASFDGRTIRTEGEIARVCQKRGCWLELTDSTGARAFVPMAGHAFTVPMQSVGRQAQIEGVVHRRERTKAERDHLKSDGAGDDIPAVSIEANAVVIRSSDRAAD